MHKSSKHLRHLLYLRTTR